ncbi:MAG: hypothetical protein LBR53_06130 [Deltaproteobacteria bacterium]|jgi:hypothetical protein|nr:hypothetical protein [Deltaproteobacteria bacterium]
MTISNKNKRVTRSTDDLLNLYAERSNNLLKNIIEESFIPNLRFNHNGNFRSIDSLINEALKKYNDLLYQIKLDILNKK